MKRRVAVLFRSVPIDKIVEDIRYRLRNDWDLCVCIDGEEGSGKSTLAIELAKRIDDKFNLKRNILFAPTVGEIKKSVELNDPYSAIVLDEAINVAYKMDFNTQLSKFLKKFFNLNRQDNQCVFLLIPNFLDLDKYYRNHRIKLWIKVTDRGHYVVQKPIKNWFSRDKYLIGDNEKFWAKKEGKRKVSSWSAQHQIVRKLKTYVGEGTFKQLPKGLDRRYKLLKKETKYQALVLAEESKMKESRLRIMWRTLMNGLNKIGILQKDLASLTGLSNKAISRYCEYPLTDDYISRLNNIIEQRNSKKNKKLWLSHNKDYVKGRNLAGKQYKGELKLPNPAKECAASTGGAVEVGVNVNEK